MLNQVELRMVEAVHRFCEMYNYEDHHVLDRIGDPDKIYTRTGVWISIGRTDICLSITDLENEKILVVSAFDHRSYGTKPVAVTEDIIGTIHLGPIDPTYTCNYRKVIQQLSLILEGKGYLH